MAPHQLPAKVNQLFIWVGEQQDAFDRTKAVVTNAITYPNLNKPITIYPNASQKYAMEAMLTQDNNGMEKIIGVFLQKFIDARLKYMVDKQELLAIFKTHRFFYDTIYGCEVIICCDHMNIINAETKDTASMFCINVSPLIKSTAQGLNKLQVNSMHKQMVSLTLQWVTPYPTI